MLCELFAIPGRWWVLIFSGTDDKWQELSKDRRVVSLLAAGITVLEFLDKTVAPDVSKRGLDTCLELILSLALQVSMETLMTGLKEEKVPACVICLCRPPVGHKLMFFHFMLYLKDGQSVKWGNSLSA